MEQADTTGYLEPAPWDETLDREWDRQMAGVNGTAAASLARERIPATPPPVVFNLAREQKRAILQEVDALRALIKAKLAQVAVLDRKMESDKHRLRGGMK